MPPLSAQETSAQKGGLSAFAWKLLEHAPLSAEWAIDQSLHVLSSITHWRVSLTRLTGTHPVTGKDTSVIVADNQPVVEYFTRHLTGVDFATEDLGHTPIWKLPQVCAEVGDDATLFIAHVDSVLGRLLFRGKQLHIPVSIGTLLVVPENGDVTDRARRGQSSLLKLIRKNKFDWNSAVAWRSSIISITTCMFPSLSKGMAMMPWFAIIPACGTTCATAVLSGYYTTGAGSPALYLPSRAIPCTAYVSVPSREGKTR